MGCSSHTLHLQTETKHWFKTQLLQYFILKKPIKLINGIKTELIPLYGQDLKMLIQTVMNVSSVSWGRGVIFVPLVEVSREQTAVKAQHTLHIALCFYRQIQSNRHTLHIALCFYRQIQNRAKGLNVILGPQILGDMEILTAIGMPATCLGQPQSTNNSLRKVTKPNRRSLFSRLPMY